MKWLSNLSTSSELPWVFSISYQDLEYSVSKDYASRVNAEFMKHSAQGRTFVTGSGDWGVGCRDSKHCKVFTADFTSSSPYVTSLGATRIAGVSNGNYSEVGIDFSSGGFSNYFSQPSFQSSAISTFLNGPSVPSRSLFNVSGRAFPDISCVGNNFQVYIGGQVESVAGTSASTPTWAAQVSLLNSLRLAKNLPTMGWINPFIYQNQDLFKDIVKGDKQDQGCCSASFAAVPGWDPYTGLGTPNWGLLAEAAMSAQLFD